MRLGDVFLRTAVLEGGPDLTKALLVERLLTVLAQAGCLSRADLPAVRNAILRREELGATAIGQGLALPHARHPTIERPVGVLALCRPPIPFDALDGEPVDLFVLCLFPPEPMGRHLGQASREIQGLLRRFADVTFCQRLRRAETAYELTELMRAEDGMSLQQWNDCQDPQTMIRFLIATDAPRVQDVAAFPDCKVSNRKLRLFACACYGRLRASLPCPLSRKAVEVAERFAEGTASEEELRRAEEQVWRALEEMEPRWRAALDPERVILAPAHGALALALQVTHPLAPIAAYYASSNACHTAADLANPFHVEHHGTYGRYTSQSAEERAQARLLREIFGPDPLDPPILESIWRTSDVLGIARSIHAEGDFGAMPVLADALEDAGCDEGEWLTHLRGPGGHVRGCYVLDAILGKV